MTKDLILADFGGRTPTLGPGAKDMTFRAGATPVQTDLSIKRGSMMLLAWAMHSANGR